MEKNEYKKKMKLYESFGALKFQKLVFLIEKIKFKVLKKLCPNFIYYFDKYCDWKEKKRVKKAKTEKEIKKIKKQTKKAKMAMRQEWNEEKNRNYHMNPKKPTEIVAYLEWNKNIHKKGLITNAVLIPIIGIYGAAVASLITQFFTNVLVGYIIKPIWRNNELMVRGANPKYVVEAFQKLRRSRAE